MVKWVEKPSFDWLNKLFTISTSERNHETLLTDQNLQVVDRDSEPYIIPNLPRFAPKVLVPNEHFVLKYLPFYEEAQITNVKAKQD